MSREESVLDTSPRRAESLSWLCVGVCSVAIVCLVPYARALQAAAEGALGKDAALYLVVLAAAMALAAVLRSMWRRGLPLSAYFGLAVVATVGAAYGATLRRQPEEMLHLVSYGLLGLLVFRALVHRIHDSGIYLVAIALVAAVGIVDEWVQWLTPQRFWDLRDVRINATAGVLAQLVIAFGLRPPQVRGLPGAYSISRFCLLAALVLGMLGVSHLNTPDRVAAYTARVPALGFLLDERSVMAQYGYRHREPGGLGFDSSFTLAELDMLDRRRGSAVGAALRGYMAGVSYRRFAGDFTPQRDRYAREVGQRLFRRNHHAGLAGEAAPGSAAIALGENRILERYFPQALAAAGEAWAPEVRHGLLDVAGGQAGYVSALVPGLIIGTSETLLVGQYLAVAALLLVAGLALGRVSAAAGPSLPGDLPRS